MANRTISSNGSTERVETVKTERSTDETTAEALASVQHASVDVAYAIRQLRQYRDIGRALDALQRVQETLSRI